MEKEKQQERRYISCIGQTELTGKDRPLYAYTYCPCVWGGGGACHCFSSFKNVYGLRVYGYTAAAKSATALQERTLAGRVFHSAGPRKNGRRVQFMLVVRRRKRVRADSHLIYIACGKRVASRRS